MLDDISSPKDIKSMSSLQLNKLAEEIRARLISVTSKNGGHLAPNLGIVELTLALHTVFNPPSDQIIWDVGHQAYVHKIITGRNQAFDSLRTFDGLSGFPKRSESDYDVFDTGHSSTSISAATGFALARDLEKKQHEVIAVIGDGAMTGGMAFEALNHIGHLGLNVKVVLNDNEMSIEKNIGGLNNHLTRLRSDPSYLRAKKDFAHMINKLPLVGGLMTSLADRLKDAMKYVLLPSVLFEELGFKYYGPVDGHNIDEMTSVFENTKHINRPVLIHCITKKGKGYIPAEIRPDKFHGTGAFDVPTGESLAKNKVQSYTDIFADTLIRLAKDDDKICAITAAMGGGTGVSQFRKEFPERTFDVGIAEQHATTMAAALALAGQKPTLAIYSTFLQRSFDQLMHDCALQNAPVVIGIDRAGLVGEDGPTHHGVYDLSYLRMMPNMTIMSPKDGKEFQDMIYSAFAYRSLVAIRYPRGGDPKNSRNEVFTKIEKGSGEHLVVGEKVCLLAIGSMVQTALEAHKMLVAEGVSCGVVNARFVKPLDESLLKDVFNAYESVITLEENALAGGFGSAVLEWCETQQVDSRSVLRLGIQDEFIEAGSVQVLKEKIKLDAKGVVRVVQNHLQREFVCNEKKD